MTRPTTSAARPATAPKPTRPRPSVLVVGALALGGCLWRPSPIPPPMAQVQALTDCDGTSECPAGGVLVDVDGVAQPGALVIVENVSRSLSSGISYSASTFAARAASDAGGADGGVSGGPGRFFVRLGPARGAPGGPVTVSQRGDVISVRQLVEGEGGRFDSSNAVTFTVR